MKAVSKRLIIPIMLIITLTVVGCEILPKRKEPPPKPETPLRKEEAPSKMMAQFYFEEGISHYLKGNLDRAISCFAEALKLDPQHPKARKMFEESLMKRAEVKEIKPKEPTKPKEEIDKEPERRVEELPIHKEQRGIPPKEETTVKVAKKSQEEEKATQTTPEEEIPVEKLAPPEEEKRKKRKEKKVEEISQEELRWFEFAKDLKRRGMYDEAIEEFNGLLEEYPKTLLVDRVTYLQAETHFAKGEYPEAEKAHQTLVDDYPQSPLLDDARLRIADSYLARGEYDQALVRYLRLSREFKEIAMKTLPEQEKKEEITPLPRSKALLAAKAQLGVAECYRLKKDFLDALIEYYEVVRFHSDSICRAQALYYIGHIYDFVDNIRDFKRATVAYERVIEDHPESPWAPYAQERKEHIEKNYL